MPPQELTFGDWNSDTASSSNVDIASGGDTFTLAEVVPNSSVARDPDDKSNSFTEYFGIRVSTDVEWPGRFDGRISQNTSGVTRARLIRVSDNTTLNTVDISGLSAGDVFSFDLGSALQTSEQYDVVLDAEGSSYTVGFFNGDNSPYVSADGNLSIDTGVRESGGSSTMNTVSEVGNLA